MLSRVKVLSRLRPTVQLAFCRYNESTDAAPRNEIFFQKEVQTLLHNLTTFDIDKIFEAKPRGKTLRPPIYKFLTSNELKREQELAADKARNMLQIPPVIAPKEDNLEILCEDPGLDGFDEHHSKHVFIDISVHLKHEERAVVVREPNGILRKAHRHERYRMNQIYYPIQGRELETPKMFEDEHLNSVLDREEYIFILDRACIQFEPDDPAYIDVTSKTYETINERNHHLRLDGTRHFGSMIFYLTINKKINNLLIEFLKNNRLQSAYLCVELYHLIHPECASATAKSSSSAEKLENYIAMDANPKEELELTLQNLMSQLNHEEKISAA